MNDEGPSPVVQRTIGNAPLSAGQGRYRAESLQQASENLQQASESCFSKPAVKRHNCRLICLILYPS